MKTVAILGNYSGRNAGDAAILGCLLKDIASRYPNIEFHIPTINPGFVLQAFAKYNVKPVGLLPWNFSAKIYGVPVYRTAFNADLILVTDAILFDRKLYNPLYNYLWTLSRVLPGAKERGIPTVLYNGSLGPIRTPAGEKCLKRVVDSADVLILRDRDSIDLLQHLKFSHANVQMGADCALNAAASPDTRFREICRNENLFATDRPVIGFNVNSYVDVFVREKGRKFGREQLVALYSQTVDRVIERLGADVIFIETQHMDMRIAQQVLDQIKNKEHIRLISNKRYSYRDICAVMRRLQLFAGMRTHSLILSSAMHIPPVGILTYPKNLGYMRTIGLEHNLIDFRELSVDRYSDLIISMFENRQSVRNEMIPRVNREKEKASAAADILAHYLQ